MNQRTVIDDVREQYADVAKSSLSNDSKAVRSVAAAFGYSQDELASLPEQANMGLSCGNPLALASVSPGEVVVDLGCGGGIDVFLAAQKVGPKGKVIGIDMTSEMLDRARAGVAKLGLMNVELHQSTIDRLPIEDNSVDCIISNCVINLVPDKAAVFREILRVLKPGGRVAISDIALKQPLPANVKESVEAYVGCISGAILINEYRDELLDAGFESVVVSDTGADLNAYSNASSSGCCGASLDSTSTSALHDGLAAVMKSFDANAFAASVRVHAIKHSDNFDSKPVVKEISMKNVQVYDKPMCCSTGVCGPQVDPVFDTAPTGHTLRLLTLPSAWAGFMEKNTTGTSCLGPLTGLQAQQKLYQDTVKALGDPKVTTLVLVARAEGTALREAARTSNELAGLGVKNQHLVVNGVFQATDLTDPYALAMQKRGETAMDIIPKELANLPRTIIPLSGGGVLGVEALRNLGVPETTSSMAAKSVATVESIEPKLLTLPPLLGELIEDLAEKKHGVILAMGKGGVGKTTVAAAVAVALAERGFTVHLSTTDPAAHIAAAVAGETLANLSVSRIDPVAETAKYSAEVMSNAGGGLDEQGKSLLAEDLRSPCTEEIAVFRAFADAVAQGSDGFVVLDTAPTGHTVLLLDSALAYHREVTRQSNQMPEAVEQLLPRLRDPDYTRVLIVTLPEATPVHEAASLQRDLRRAEIEPYAWVINQCLSPLTIHDPLLQERQLHEGPYIREVMEKQSQRTVLIPWQIDPPVGKIGLEHLLQNTDLSIAKA